MCIRDRLDPVRYLSNRSTGRMGYALAAVAEQGGAQVTLVSGPTSLPVPFGVERIDVVTAEDMYQATRKYFPEAVSYTHLDVYKRQAGVNVAPGNGYGQYGEGFFRIALTCSEQRLGEAVDRMRQQGIFFAGKR